MPAIQKINYFSAVNRIARQSVGVPRQNSVRFATLYPIEHFVKNGAARNFGRLFFHQLINNVEIFLFRKGAQFCNLVLDGTHLLVLNIGGFAGIQKEFLRDILCVVIHKIKNLNGRPGCTQSKLP
ncbi:MAG: hypothetical protein A3C81_00880 [Candidatus Yanofskybacteria bacterium RIFCSPHIGHO2_02_FULL_46_19]|uniref:Uncharacterized protein n=2 Tax=Candidatus Yanofskyibacteriota TaxID=1752733 RepID=A0A1F8H2B2_9BACT|nr:MAG: hypothetical protein A3C81_00880 [Candidatus Yanofskybacteria bacterium RIFCSPHIGHO2_02_FULL_46_19]OGN31772.1 MAG: hypothetical protein A3J01_03200 [Candidatus Yanofskybacteria bacterium RIFCSPLOWO2_02_FULL_45_18]